MTKIKFAIIGYGHIGKRHAEMIRRNPEAELVAVCDTLSKDKLGLNDLKEKFYTSADDLLKSHPEVEVINICSPNGLHAEHSLKALEANKHLVVEKPMALHRQDCEQIISKALQKHKQVFCVMQNRYSPPSVWLKDVIEKKIIGDIFMVQLNCYWNRDERYYHPLTGISNPDQQGMRWKGKQELDGGTLFTQFSHWIDLLYWMFGDITDIQAKFADFNHALLTEFEDSGFVAFRFVNGGMGSINYSTSVWDKNLESSITIVGSNGSVKVGGQYMDKVEYCHIKDYRMPELSPTAPANDYGSYKGSANNHHFLIENVIDALKGRQTITTNALEGLKVVDIIERIYSFRKPNRKS
ncbi:MAG: Gfo/Idh/MocA family oxidoreductase [Bacteroidetes bacterium]|nr:MAG: Gfo/Idh/MocA family oxidoreductase [Bacteroidota bacterium]